MDLGQPSTMVGNRSLYVWLAKRRKATKSWLEPIFSSREVALLVSGAVLTVAVLTALRLSGDVDSSDMLGFAGTAFGVIAAIYGAHKIERIREIRGRNHAAADLLDIAESAAGTLAIMLDGEEDSSPWIPQDLYELRLRIVDRHMAPIFARLETAAPHVNDGNLLRRRALAEISWSGAQVRALLQGPVPKEDEERGNSIDRLNAQLAHMQRNFVWLAESIDTTRRPAGGLNSASK